ncbi:MAG: hypothetical protein AABY07_11125 [Nanoarchaeota archaeon]
MTDGKGLEILLELEDRENVLPKRVFNKVLEYLDKNGMHVGNCRRSSSFFHSYIVDFCAHFFNCS